MNYQGISVHDGFTSYPQYECDHALCNAHHLRELIFVKEQLGQGWAGDFIGLLLELKEAVSTARKGGQEALLPQQLEPYHLRYDALIGLGLAANPSPPVEIETRQITSSMLEEEYLGWPNVRQVFKLESWVKRSPNSEESYQVRYGITSLPREVAGAKRLM